MDTSRLISYWKLAAAEKWKTAESLMRAHRYADALFFCHLALEARLKGAVVEKTGEPAPYIHDLEQLGLMAVKVLNTERRQQLAAITTFNIRARYDNYKRSFYKKATRSYTKKYFKITQALLVWLDQNE